MGKVTDKTGLKFGTLTVIDYPPVKDAPVRCRCDCGDERAYPRHILKPSYRGPLMCPLCAGVDCEICGRRIEYHGRQQAVTCSDSCDAERHRRIERQRYSQIKHTDDFKAKYRARVERHRERMKTDPDYAVRYTANARRNLRKYRSRLDESKRERFRKHTARYMQIYDAIRNADPERRESWLEYQRRCYRQRRDRAALIAVTYYRLVTVDTSKNGAYIFGMASPLYG